MGSLLLQRVRTQLSDKHTQPCSSRHAVNHPVTGKIEGSLTLRKKTAIISTGSSKRESAEGKKTLAWGLPRPPCSPALLPVQGTLQSTVLPTGYSAPQPQSPAQLP